MSMKAAASLADPSNECTWQKTSKKQKREEKNPLSRKKPYNNLVTHPLTNMWGNLVCTAPFKSPYRSLIEFKCGLWVRHSKVHFLLTPSFRCYGYMLELLKNFNMKLLSNFSNRIMKVLWQCRTSSAWQRPYCATFSPLDDECLHMCTYILLYPFNNETLWGFWSLLALAINATNNMLLKSWFHIKENNFKEWLVGILLTGDVAMFKTD